MGFGTKGSFEQPYATPTAQKGDEIWGLHGLSDRDRITANAGNRQARSVIAMRRASIAAGTQGYLEQPRGSLMWHILRTKFNRETLTGVIRIVPVDLCQYGVPWEKPASIMIWGKSAPAIPLKCCTGPVCSRTGLPHEKLSSPISVGDCIKNGRFRTSYAQVYPKSL